MWKVIVVGPRGKMGKLITQIAANRDDLQLVAGVGPDDNRRRDGSYEYYISEPIVENDAKGIGPLILAYTEVKKLI